jgi:eukaryotic-like serine/threonine-protein kinase
VFKFITDRSFFINLLTATVLFFLLIFLFLQTLSFITKHGEYLTVPALVGKNTNDAIKLLESKGFEVMIQDSVFTDTAARGTVIKQLPDPNATVKVNRIVFLTVNRFTPPMIDMPKLEGLSLRFALDLLQRNHLQLADTVFKPDFMKGSILEQQYNGAKILPGAKIQWGSKVTLVVGSGLTNEQMLVPDLVGMTYAQAKALLDSNKIGIGAVITQGLVKDSGTAFIFKQNPSKYDEEKKPVYIQSGQLMDVWISPQMIYLKDTLDNKTNEIQ